MEGFLDFDYCIKFKQDGEYAVSSYKEADLIRVKKNVIQGFEDAQSVIAE